MASKFKIWHGFALACIVVALALMSVNIWVGGLITCALIGLAAFVVARDRRDKELVQAEFDRFFTLSLDLLCIAGLDGYFKRLSPSFSEVLGIPLEQLYREKIVDLIHPDDVEKTRAEIARQAAGGKVFSFENRYRCKDGSYRTFSWKSVPAGQFMYAVARDVSQQKAFEAELLNAREVAQNAALTKSAFIANMSHEIRTPLNGVVGMAELLARTELNEDQRKYLSGIRGSASILMSIVNEVLDFSKIEAGRMHLDVENFEIRQLVESRLSLLSVLAQEKGLQLSTEIDVEIPPVLKGDAGKIGQVLLNLLNNAVKFTEAGSIELEVKSELLSNKACRLRFSVRDTGVGLNESQIARLFEPFVQVDNSLSRKFGGTGLGLSICKRLVEIMGGQIGVQSQEHQGTTFWFTVELEISNLKAVHARTSIPQKEIPPLNAAVTASRKALRVLIAEDNKMNQLIVMNMMNALGYKATLAQNGRAAVDLYKSEHFDLILMDQHMPVLNGIEASEEIRRFEMASGGRVPIIAFTATVIQEEQKAQFQALMDDFILKPVTLESLESVLGNWEARLTSVAKH